MKPLAAVALGVLLVAAACTRESGGSGVPGFKSVRAERDVEDGIAKVSSTITVTFDGPTRAAPSKVPLASHFELLVPVPGSEVPRRVLVRSAEMRGEAGRQVVLRVDVLVPAGTVLRLARQAFEAGAEGSVEAAVESELSLGTVLLAAGPLALGRTELLAEATTAEVTAADRDPAAVRAALEASLRKRGTTDEVRVRALSTYDTIPVALVPGPKARAALAVLTGTFAEPAIEALLGSANCTNAPVSVIAFQPPPDAPNLLARVTTRGGRRMVSLNPVVEGERIEHLATLLAHEAIHCDQADGRFEEVAATAFDSFLYLEMVAADPSLATAGTRLARDLNIDAVAMINSGRRWPESAGVLRSQGVTRVLPGTTSIHASFADLVVAAYPGIDYNESPTEPLAKAYVERLAARSGMAAGDPFDLRYLDELLGASLSPDVLAAAISALGLVPPT